MGTEPRALCDAQHRKGIDMKTRWKHNGNNLHYLIQVPRSPRPDFIGAYGQDSGAVYRRNGTTIQYLPDNLILDEALAVAKIIIMTERNTHDQK
jgi:hypothetical protein